MPDIISTARLSMWPEIESYPRKVVSQETRLMTSVLPVHVNWLRCYVRYYISYIQVLGLMVKNDRTFHGQSQTCKSGKPSKVIWMMPTKAVSNIGKPLKAIGKREAIER